MRSVNHKERPRLEITVNSECLYLKGTGSDVEPVLLSGHVTLDLAEPSSVKEITLQFRGKTRLPPNEPLYLHDAHATYVVCNHKWSFLEGQKQHGHALKAGRHVFPFQLQIGGSLPSSIDTRVLGGASVSYKLRALVRRPGLSRNLQAITPITIVRSFVAEALEYQQTLEIESTWPGKVMYSIVLPHKAWAAGDTLSAPIKLSTLSKGLRLMSIVTTVHEFTRVSSQGRNRQINRTIATTKHDLVNGVPVEFGAHRPTDAQRPQSDTTPNTPGFPASSLLPGAGSRNSPTSDESNSSNTLDAGPSSSRSSTADLAFMEPESSTPNQDNQVDTFLTIQIPHSAIPTHTFKPIFISHRVQWSIFIANFDGHVSELRCSLPLYVLDNRLLNEARSATASTRRLVLGGPEEPQEEEEDMQLPSYASHVQDRVANMYLPDAATIRVTTPWNNLHRRVIVDSTVPSSEASSLIEPHSPASISGSSLSSPFDWVNSEFLLSSSSPEPISPHSTLESDSQSLLESLPSSRRESRNEHHESSSERPSTPDSVSPNVVATYVHGRTDPSRNVHGLFTISMKLRPFASFGHSSWLTSRSKSHSTVKAPRPSSDSESRPQRGQIPNDRPVVGPSPRFGTLDDISLVYRALTDVPSYDIASRGFIGGVPPLSSFSGLPIYEELDGSR